MSVRRTRQPSRGRFVLSGGSLLPLGRQVAMLLGDAVLDGQLGPGAKLPSTRGLAAELGVSRNTVLEAYGQLLAEGYLEARVGSGTFVARSLPEDLRSTPARTPVPLARQAASTLSARGARIAAAYHAASGDELRAFNPGFPAVDPDLLRAWWRTAARRHRQVQSELLSYGDPAGYEPLRQAIATHLGPARGVRCTPAQVIVTTGSQRALALVADLLTDPGDPIWIEDPGYSGARRAFAGAGCELVPVPVDEEGLDVESAIGRAPRARVVYVSPSHQYPLGVTMSIARRLRLLEWAARTGAWIIEDDYDSEFRHGSRPLPTLHALDRTARVLYLGTFSKVLFPALRLGYIVVPGDLEHSFQRAQAVGGQIPPTVEQAVLADFIRDGHLSRHVRRLRTRYEQLRRTLEGALAREVGDLLQVTGAEVGLHVFARLAQGFDDTRISRQAFAAGVTAPAVASYYIGAPRTAGLVLGYGHLNEAAIQRGVERLASVVAPPRKWAGGGLR